MLLVTLGTVEYPFERPISWFQTLVDQGLLKEPVFIQHGSTELGELSHSPLITSASLIPQAELIDLAQQSRLVITHGGDGSIRLFAQLGVRFIVIPRLANHGEHIDNHQLQLLDSLGLSNERTCFNFDDLKHYLEFPPEANLSKQFSEIPRLAMYLSSVYPGTQSARTKQLINSK